MQRQSSAAEVPCLTTRAECMRRRSVGPFLAGRRRHRRRSLHAKDGRTAREARAAAQRCSAERRPPRRVWGCASSILGMLGYEPRVIGGLVGATQPAAQRFTTSRVGDMNRSSFRSVVPSGCMSRRCGTIYSGDHTTAIRRERTRGARLLPASRAPAPDDANRARRRPRADSRQPRRGHPRWRCVNADLAALRGELPDPIRRLEPRPAQRPACTVWTSADGRVGR